MVEKYRPRRSLFRGSNRVILRLLLLIISLSYSVTLSAQLFPTDPLTIQAYINDHRQQRYLLTLRSTLEESNKLLHKASTITTKDYKDINIALEKYTKAFDVIDLVFNAVSTGLNVYETFDNVSDKIGKIKNLLDDYNDRILLRGKIETADTLLLNVSTLAIADISEEVSRLKKNINYLLVFCSGELQCTPASISLMVLEINNSVLRINSIVNSCYYRLFKFISVRTTLWKRDIYRSKTMKQVAEEAYFRWIDSSGNKKK